MQMAYTCIEINVIWIFFNKSRTQVRATDGGIPSKSSTARVNVMVLPIPDESFTPPPVIKDMDQQVDVQEIESVGYLVAFVSASIEDGSHLWYRIEGESLAKIGTSDFNQETV